MYVLFGVPGDRYDVDPRAHDDDEKSDKSGPAAYCDDSDSGRDARSVKCCMAGRNVLSLFK